MVLVAVVATQSRAIACRRRLCFIGLTRPLPQPILRSEPLTPSSAISKEGRPSLRAYIAKNADLALMLLVMLAAVAIIIVFFLIYFDAGVTMSFGDGITKLNNARRVFDNVQGKLSLAQIGGVWLPLMSLLMLPTIWIDPMYHNGLSGSVTSMVSFVATAVIVFEIVRTLTGSRLGALAASAVVLLNINLIYFGTTPMTEVLLVAALSMSALALVKLERSPRSTGWLLGASVALAVSALVRYEAWFLIVVAVPIMAVAFWTKHIRGRELLARLMTLFALPAFLMFCWLFLWEAPIFGNPLFFAQSRYSAHAIDVVGGDRLGAVHNLTVSLDETLSAMRWNFDDAVLLLAAAGIAIYLLRLWLRKEKLVTPAYLLAIPIFYVTSLYLGQNAIEVHPKGTGALVMNTRYGLIPAALVSVAVGYLAAVLAGLRNRFLVWPGRAIATGIIVAVAVLSVSLWGDPVGNIHLDDSLGASPQGRANEVALFLEQNYNGGSILIESFGAESGAVELESGIPLRKFITEASPDLWEKALEDPLSYVDWVFVKRDNDTVGERMAQIPDFSEEYAVAFARSDQGTLYVRADQLQYLEGEGQVEP